MDIEIRHIGNSYNFDYRYDGSRFDHTLTVPEDCNPTDDALFRIAILARPARSEVFRIHGVKANKETVDRYSKNYRSKIEVSSGIEDEETAVAINELSDKPINLCFSGGFDSVAALALLGQPTRLISNDFGGAFQREAEFFGRFDVSVCHWGIRGTRPKQKIKFNESLDWRFMLAPALCFREKGEPYIIATGTIMEASPFWYRGESWPTFSGYSDFGFGPNVSVVNPVSSLTEYSTAKIAAHYFDNEMLDRSLESLAAKESLKRYRKEILISLVKDRNIPNPSHNMRRHKFGSNFTDDILALYLTWKLGHSWVLENYCEGVPRDAKFIDMSFFEKINSFNLERFDSVFKQKLVDKISIYGLKMFSDGDGDRLKRSVEFRNVAIRGLAP